MVIHFLNGTTGDDGTAFVPANGTICEIAYHPWSDLRSKALQNEMVEYFERVFLRDKTALLSFCTTVRAAMTNGHLQAPLVLVKTCGEDNADDGGSYHYCNFLSTFLRKAFGENSINGSIKKNIFRRKVSMVFHEPSKRIKGAPCIYFKDKAPKEGDEPMNVFFYDDPMPPMLPDGTEQAFLSFIFRE